MDTPQVTAALLDTDWEGADAVLGLSEDGGFWAIGLRSADPRSIFAGIPMSTDRTGAAQLARLAALGLSVRLLPPLRDVDLPADAEAVAASYPWLGSPPTSRSAGRSGGADGRAALRPGLHRRRDAGDVDRRRLGPRCRPLERRGRRGRSHGGVALRAAGTRPGLRPGPNGRGAESFGPLGPRGGHVGRRREHQHEPRRTGSASADQRRTAGGRTLGHRTAHRQQRRDGR